MKVIKPKTIDLNTSNVTASALGEYNSGTTYSTNDTVKVSFESDGTTPRTPVKEYQANSGSTGKYPPDNPTEWLETGASNRWKMFDEFVSSQTTNSNSIDVTLNVTKIDTLALFGLDGELVRIILKDSTAATISDDTYSLSDNESGSWAGYFFGDFAYKESKIFNLAGYQANMTLQIIITARTGITAKCGHCIVGMSKTLGLTEYGATAGIQDYSKKDTNSFGETTFTQRAYAKTMDLDLWIDHTTAGESYDRVHKVLSRYRATPCVWDGNNETSSRESLLVYGFFQDFNLVAQFANKSSCSLTIEGLI